MPSLTSHSAPPSPSYMTYKRFVSTQKIVHQLQSAFSSIIADVFLLTQRVAAAQLRLLRVFGLELFADAV